MASSSPSSFFYLWNHSLNVPADYHQHNRYLGGSDIFQFDVSLVVWNRVTETVSTTEDVNLEDYIFKIVFIIDRLLPASFPVKAVADGLSFWCYVPF